jgi:hypothetical protein
VLAYISAQIVLFIIPIQEEKEVLGRTYEVYLSSCFSTFGDAADNYKSIIIILIDPFMCTISVVRICTAHPLHNLRVSHCRQFFIVNITVIFASCAAWL